MSITQGIVVQLAVEAGTSHPNSEPSNTDSVECAERHPPMTVVNPDRLAASLTFGEQFDYLISLCGPLELRLGWR
jgi:hypothetical protein